MSKDYQIDELKKKDKLIKKLKKENTDLINRISKALDKLNKAKQNNWIANQSKLINILKGLDF